MGDTISRDTGFEIDLLHCYLLVILGLRIIFRHLFVYFLNAIQFRFCVKYSDAKIRILRFLLVIFGHVILL